MNAQIKNCAEDARLASVVQLLKRRFLITSQTLDVSLSNVHGDLRNIRTSTGNFILQIRYGHDHWEKKS
jgi:hypothetical protein